jgi:uncharacterized protein (TIGR03066 family)
VGNRSQSRSSFRSRWIPQGGNYYGNRQSRRSGLRSSWGLWLSNGYYGWGLGSNYYGGGYFGYSYSYPIVDYYNPYCESPDFFPVAQAPTIDYSQPLTGQSSPSDAGVEAMTLTDEAFREGNYSLALIQADKAAKAMPKNADVHQFRSLILLAQGRYRESAAAAHASLITGRGWNWETLRSFYPSKEAYTAHLRALETYRNADKKNVDGRFLLGYHYMMLGHSDAAAGELLVVAELQPDDKLTVELLASISKKTGKKYTPKKATNEKNTTPPVPPKPSLGTKVPPKSVAKAAKPTAGSRMLGRWNTKHSDGSSISLQLLKGGDFVWVATKSGRTTTLRGKYTLANNQLKLTASASGKSLEGTLTPKGGNEFQLKLKYQPETEPGLSFKRQ